MSRAKCCAVLGQVWRSRGLTVGFLLAFAVAVGRGLWLGVAELRDADAQVRVAFHYASTQVRDLSLHGRAVLHTVREAEQRAVLMGPAELRIRSREAPTAMLALQIECTEARPGDVLRILDTASGARHEVRDLQAQHCDLRVPLPSADTTLRIAPSQDWIGWRVMAIEFEPGAALEPFTCAPAWTPLARDEHGVVSAGAGFWPWAKAAAPPRGLRTQRCAYLRIQPAAPGPHVLRIAAHRPDPEAPLPVFLLGSQRLWSLADGASVWSRMRTADGVTEWELRCDLAADNVIAIECPGRFRNPQELGLSQDLSRVAYSLHLDRLSVTPAK